jgi:hypothetical protein
VLSKLTKLEALVVFAVLVRFQAKHGLPLLSVFGAVLDVLEFIN